MIRILNAEPLDYSEAARAVLKSIGEVDERALDRASLIGQLPFYDVLIVRLALQIDREVLDQGNRLRAIVTATTGLDHIDVEYAKQRGISILSLRGETEFLRSIPATAEHTWALLLALTRHIPAAFASVCEGAWQRDAFRGHDLNDKRLGLVGLGRIGEKVANYGLAFGLSVAAYDPYKAEWLPQVRRCTSLEELLESSDVLSIHVPSNAETRRFIGLAELTRLPSGALLINTSRGEVLDEEALVTALDSGRLAGAGLDVIWHERSGDLFNNPLLAYARQHTNLLITPHIGGATVESMRKTEVFMATQLKNWLQASTPIGQMVGSGTSNE